MDIIKGITFNGKHSYRDMGLVLSNRNIGYPSKEKIIEKVPFASIEYDFSNLYGAQSYSNRTLVYKFNLKNNSSTSDGYYALESEIINWLYGTLSKSKLTDDALPGVYFLAEPVEEPGTQRIKVYGGILEITFTAYPFKIGEHFEGDDIWDTFNFLEDYAQETSFIVEGSRSVTLYNPSLNPVSPTIITSRDLVVADKNGRFHSVNEGTNVVHNFMLFPGENRISILGRGTIEFKFRKEVL